MLSNDKKYEESVKKNMFDLASKRMLPGSHYSFLEKLKNEYKFEPSICYDIGAAVVHWTNPAKNLWPSSKFIVFDAFSPAEELYQREKLDYHMGVLSDTDNKIVKFYQNDFSLGGNSYYMEIGCATKLYFEDKFIEKSTRSLDSLVKERNFPLPDLIKIDVQGAELDIINGGLETIKNATYLIVEMQHTNYNKDAPMVTTTKPYIESLGWKCIAERFSDNGPDADYCFVNKSKCSFFSEK